MKRGDETHSSTRSLDEALSVEFTVVILLASILVYEVPNTFLVYGAPYRRM